MLLASPLSSSSSAASPEGTPRTDSPERQRPVYQYVQELDGITSVEYGPRDVMDAPSLGKYADAYVQSHGFTITAITQVSRALYMCKTEEKFVDMLVGQFGHPVKQAKWLWYITNKTPKARFATVTIT